MSIVVLVRGARAEQAIDCAVLAQIAACTCASLATELRHRLAMVLLTENVHPAGLDFANQRKAVILRDVNGLTFPDIAKRLKNLRGQSPAPRLVADTYHKFSAKAGRRQYKYKKCGRKPWKLDKETKTFLVSRLKVLRRMGPCATTTLQQVLAREKAVRVERSAIAKALKSQGYFWLPRAQKRKYSKKDMAARLAWAQQVVDMGPKKAKAKLSMAMDGVVLSMPPSDPTDRLNWCRHGEDRMWRKKSEMASPELAGKPSYDTQVPLQRALPLWGGISAGGFAEILYHKTKKVGTAEWVRALQQGRLRKALGDLNPGRKKGPWTVLADNEVFLKAADAKAEYARLSVSMWHIPARSPDLNPIEKYWGWLRRQLRALDLKDALAKRRPLNKTAYRRRVRAVCRSPKAKAAAAAFANGLLRVCKEVVKKKGAASRG